MKKPPLHPTIERAHDQAVEAGRETYRDPETGRLVFTRLAHERRGYCCGNRCRHCPFDWKNVPQGPLAILLALCLAAATAWGQTSFIADSVLSFQPGTIQTNGQGAVFFPRNVLRGPTAVGTETVPDTDPREICSIGLGGSITIGFAGRVVTDGPGADLVIVENAFRYGNGRIYAEPARVEVSRDGVAWTLFPFDSATLVGCAGRTPGGDVFDLADVGVDSVRWVRITDVTDIVRNNPRHAFFDPTLTGFDLDVVIALSSVPKAFELDVEDVVLSTSVRVFVPRSATMTVFDVGATRVRSQQLEAGVHDVDLAGLPAGAYFVVIEDGADRRTLKVLR